MQLPAPTRVAGVRALVWHAKEKPKAALLFIPGNPGMSAHYSEYLSHVYHIFDGQCTILCKGSPGQDDTVNAPPPTGNMKTSFFNISYTYYGLLDQISSQATALEAIRNAVPADTPIIVQGHSMGSYVALELLRMHPEMIQSVHLLFPALCHIGRAPQARFTRRWLWPPWLVFLQLVSWLLARLPLAWSLGLVHMLTGQTRPFARVTAELIRRPHALVTALCTFHDELCMIQNISDHVVACAKNKIVLCYWAQGDSDSWSPAWQRKYAEKTFELVPWPDPMSPIPPAKHTCTECSHGLPHSFCLGMLKYEVSIQTNSAGPYATMAKITAHWLHTDVENVCSSKFP